MCPRSWYWEHVGSSMHFVAVYQILAIRPCWYPTCVSPFLERPRDSCTFRRASLVLQPWLSFILSFCFSLDRIYLGVFFFCFLVDISTLKSQRAPSFPFSFVILDLKIVFSHYIDYFLQWSSRICQLFAIYLSNFIFGTLTSRICLKIWNLHLSRLIRKGLNVWFA